MEDLYLIGREIPVVISYCLGCLICLLCIPSVFDCFISQVFHRSEKGDPIKISKIIDRYSRRRVSN